MGGVCTLAGSIRAGLLDENKTGKKPWTDKKKKKKKHVVLAVFVSKRGYMQNWAEGSRKRGCFVGIKEDDYKQEGLDGFSWYW